jgi:phosphoribosylformylglycinamidine (FGAM) synthase PurS component
VANAARLTIRTIGPDPRAAGLLADAHALGLTEVTSLDVADVVWFDAALTPAQKKTLEAVLVDPLLQKSSWSAPKTGVDTELLPGVTDSVATAVMLAARTVDLPEMEVATGRHFTVKGSLQPETIPTLARRLLANQVIERWAEAPLVPSFIDTHATAEQSVDHVAIRDLDDDALQQLNKERGLSLDPAELRAIVDHFRGVGREPTDVELETLAQTWSEHCAHKTFRALITLDDGTQVDAADEATARLHRRHQCSIRAQFVRRQRRHPQLHARASPSPSRPRRTTTRRPSSPSAARTPVSAASSAT